MDANQKKWIMDTISTINDWAKDMTQFDKKTQEELDQRIQDDIADFVSIPEFYSIPLPIIIRNIKRAQYVFSSREAAIAMRSCLEYHKAPGLGVLGFIQLREGSGTTAFEAIKELTDSPIINQLVIHPFGAPSKIKSESELNLEKLQQQRKALLKETNQKMIQSENLVKDLTKRKEDGEKFKERCHNWPQDRKKYEDAIDAFIEENKELEEDNLKWKNAAFRKFDTKKQTTINHDICDACDKDDAESVIFLIEKDKSIINKLYESKDTGEEWTPLMHACDKGSFECVKVLLNNGADPNKKAWHGSPLSYAQKGGYSNIIALLKENGAEDY
ncbi:hypothetical protein TVAG_188140 [Trichomonas vaginalis G3]|uniref:Uncharacterized protein n=1 Tax=Trichomonas vaginalis (strain ATCC PRA-98 / G3) TaxID=412133 RepID=A2DV36_TRIV3|nr:Ankyrin repeat family [Trichomonas vaginalis G3]EAY15763.1 hypothetical protein TVAG_188140 [Trichomonas vaginalis G3]KAI5486536.1 Ankyrin repeat family [Trichomonas vaginalis G3]|eukprot:XP_001327986.1 hypothetical protein [Trichomonas vaginalis G3]